MPGPGVNNHSPEGEIFNSQKLCDWGRYGGVGGATGSVEGQLATAALWRGTRKTLVTYSYICIDLLEEWPGNNETRGDCGAISLTHGLTEDQSLGSPCALLMVQFCEVTTHSSVRHVVLRTPGFLRRMRLKTRWLAPRNSFHPVWCHFF